MSPTERSAPVSRSKTWRRARWLIAVNTSGWRSGVTTMPPIYVSNCLPVKLEYALAENDAMTLDGSRENAWPSRPCLRFIRHEMADQIRDFVGGGVQGKMAGVENVNFRRGNVAAVGLGLGQLK